MPAIDFPNSPEVNDQFTVNDRTWVWTGETWDTVETVSIPGEGGGGSITVSETAPSPASEGDLWFNSSNAVTYVYYDSFWVALAPTTGDTGPAGLIQDFGYSSGNHYGPTLINTSNLAATQSRTMYIPIYITGTRTFDRISLRTDATFAGTGTIRLGVYNTSGGKPTTVLFDAGTVSATAANTNYEITIDQTINSGWYHLAFNSQTNATTPNFLASNTITYPTMMKYASDHFGFTNAGWIEDGITGAFATAGTLAATNTLPVVVLRAS